MGKSRGEKRSFQGKEEAAWEPAVARRAKSPSDGKPSFWYPTRWAHSYSSGPFTPVFSSLGEEEALLTLTLGREPKTLDVCEICVYLKRKIVVSILNRHKLVFKR